MLFESLGLSPGDVCSLVGGGGKTSCLYSLAAEDPWGKTLLTTTTMMRDPRKKSHPFSEIAIAEREDFRFLNQRSPVFIASRIVRNSGKPGKIPFDKVAGFSPETIDRWQAEADWSLTVLEADGAACRPLKMPNHREPQIPALTTVTIGVIGLDILGRPAGSEEIHRFHLMRDKIGILPGETVSLRHLCAVIDHPEGLFKNSPEQAAKILILNKADTLETQGKKYSGHLLQSIRENCEKPDRILITTLSDYRKPTIIGISGL